jgi:DNA-binding beta-propeller fold protein YncE
VVCEESNAVVRIDEGSNSVGRPIEVGLEPRFVTVAFGSAWVSNYLDSTLTRFDLENGRDRGGDRDRVRAAGDGRSR